MSKQIFIDYNVGDTVYTISATGDIFENEVAEVRLTKDGIMILVVGGTRLIHQHEAYKSRLDAMYNYFCQRETELCTELAEVRTELDKLNKLNKWLANE